MNLRGIVERLDKWYVDKQQAALKAEQEAEAQRRSTIEQRLADSRLLFWLLLELLRPSPDNEFVAMAVEALVTEEEAEAEGGTSEAPVSEGDASGANAEDAPSETSAQTDASGEAVSEEEEGLEEEDIFDEKEEGDGLPDALRSILRETVPVPCVYVPYPRSFRVRNKHREENVYLIIPTHMGRKKGKTGDLVVIHGLGTGFKVEMPEDAPMGDYSLNPVLLFQFYQTANELMSAIEKEGFGAEVVSSAWRTLTYPADKFDPEAVRVITLVAEGNAKALKTMKPHPPPSLLVNGAKVFELWLDRAALDNALQSDGEALPEG